MPKVLADSSGPSSVIPAEAGIQSFQYVLDPGFRRGDGWKQAITFGKHYKRLNKGPIENEFCVIDLCQRLRLN